jgi:pilus assembly protein CpaF
MFSDGNAHGEARQELRLDAELRWMQIKRELHAQLIKRIDLSAFRSMKEENLRRELRTGAEELCRMRVDLISVTDRKRLVDELVDETLGFGPLEPLLRDPTVSDILVNGPKCVFVERGGQLEETNVSFDNDDHLLHVVQRIASRVGRRVDEASPMVDARLPDGSRVNVIIRPLALDGALVSIRRFANRPTSASELITRQAATIEMLAFLAACVEARLNILISGGTGSGKTTLLNILSSYIGRTERVITIEDAAELSLQQPHVARMETRPRNLEGTGEVTSRDLVRNAMRMRPDRVIVGECRGAEAFDMLQAMNTGHDGSLTTIHANNAHDALARLELLVSMAHMEVPASVIQRQIESGFQIVVQVARLNAGARKIVQIAEIAGRSAAGVELRELFAFRQQGIDAAGMPVGRFETVEARPRCAERLRACGLDWPLDGMFAERSRAFTKRLLAEQV